MKKFFVVALIAVALALASVATACKDDDDGGDTEQPEYRDTTITFNFKPNNGDAFCTAKVEGTLLLAEWNNVLATLPTAINNAYTTARDGGPKSDFTGRFLDGVTIIVKKTLDNGNKYEVKADQWDTLYLNYAYLVGNATDKSDVLVEAIIDKMGYETAGYQ